MTIEIDIIDIVLLSIIGAYIAAMVWDIPWLAWTAGGIMVFLAAYPYIREFFL